MQKSTYNHPFLLFCFTIQLLLLSLPNGAHAKPRQFTFHVTYENVTRLCSTKAIATVNGQFPGPTVLVREGDHMLIKVKNELPDKNITIHWHGIKQMRNGWADGPGYITQCPMKPNTFYTYNFNITGQRGTLWWHAHLSWMRSTVYGAFIILPKKDSSYPFPSPSQEFLLLLGEWWKNSVDKVVNQGLKIQGVVNTSDAYTINGQPGDLYSCSSKDTTVFPVQSGKTYMLRIVNAAMNGELFVSVANHTLTVVEVDAVYTKPLITDYILIGPGQTTNVLLKADHAAGNYYLAARPYIAPNVPLDNTTTTAIISYAALPPPPHPNLRPRTGRPIHPPPIFPSHLPTINDTSAAAAFSTSLRSLASAQFPAQVPLHVDHHLFFTVGLAVRPCASCTNGTSLAGAVNNISFVLPQVALLQAHYLKKPHVFQSDFPNNPIFFNFTGVPPANLMTRVGTHVSRIPFNATVELVLQDTSLVAPESHPIHLHGYNFFVVGQGFGNFNSSSHPLTFNLIDPQERNTIAVPQAGWVALRFRADNPGVWFMHCHLELHTSLGLDMAFIVENGPTLEQSIIPPPPDLPPC